MANAVNIQKIIEEYGKYYIPGSQNMQRLRHAVMQAPVTLEKHGHLITTLETEYRMANPSFESLIQPFKATFSPKGGVTFHPNAIKVPKVKIDLSLTPDEIEDSWLQFMAGVDPADKRNWPIVRWIMEVYIPQQAGKDRETKMVYKGVYNEDGATPADCMDGIRKKLIDGVSDSYPINVISGIGALDKSSMVDQVEAFDEALPSEYLEEKVIIFVAPEFYRAYLKNYRENGWFNMQSSKEIVGVIDFTGSNHVLAPLPSMAGTADMFATVKENMLWIRNRDPKEFKTFIQQDHYNVDIMVNWREAVGFACNQMVWTTIETVGGPSAEDTNSDGIIVRSLYPMANAATEIASTSAKVSGKVMGDLPDSAVVKMAYGTTTSLGTESAALTAVKGVYTAELSSLSAATKYYYRLEVSIGTDKYVSETRDFTTAAS